MASHLNGRAARFITVSAGAMIAMLALPAAAEECLLDDATGEDGFKSAAQAAASCPPPLWCPLRAAVSPSSELGSRARAAAEKVSMDLKIRIMKARQAKGLTQKELATVRRARPVGPSRRALTATPRFRTENVREAAGGERVREREGDPQPAGPREDGAHSGRQVTRRAGPRRRRQGQGRQG